MNVVIRIKISDSTRLDESASDGYWGYEAVKNYTLHMFMDYIYRLCNYNLGALFTPLHCFVFLRTSVFFLHLFLFCQHTLDNDIIFLK